MYYVEFKNLYYVSATEWTNDLMVKTLFTKEQSDENS